MTDARLVDAFADDGLSDGMLLVKDADYEHNDVVMNARGCAGRGQPRFG